MSTTTMTTMTTKTTTTTTMRDWLWIEFMAVMYVLSGVCQPLLMTVLKSFGLTNPIAQLYMWFYYLGPSMWIFYAWNTTWPTTSTSATTGYNKKKKKNMYYYYYYMKVMGIGLVDVISQALNYTGAIWAGPTIFGIVYSSVTIWTAIWAKCFLQRQLSIQQWFSICLVFIGLTITTWENIWMATTTTTSSTTSSTTTTTKKNASQVVLQGTICILIGSALHAAIYVWTEAVLTKKTLVSTTTNNNNNKNSNDDDDDNNDNDDIHHEQQQHEEGHVLTVPQNATLQCGTCTLVLGLWQLIYTVPNWSHVIAKPVHDTGTSWILAITMLLLFSLLSWIHASSFYWTIQQYRGGCVMAGIMKGLQAVLVFVAAHFVYCGRTNRFAVGKEVCFSNSKFISLLAVVSGVIWFSLVTPPTTNNSTSTTGTTTTTTTTHHESTRSKQNNKDNNALLLLLSSSSSTSYDKQQQEHEQQQQQEHDQQQEQHKRVILTNETTPLVLTISPKRHVSM